MEQVVGFYENWKDRKVFFFFAILRSLVKLHHVYYSLYLHGSILDIVLGLSTFPKEMFCWTHHFKSQIASAVT